MTVNVGDAVNFQDGNGEDHDALCKHTHNATMIDLVWVNAGGTVVPETRVMMGEGKSQWSGGDDEDEDC